MSRFGLVDWEQELICEVLRRHLEVAEARVFGSRAKGAAQPNSDVDLVLFGAIPLWKLAAIAGELDDLPLPYNFDVVAYGGILHQPLRDHIDRVGRSFYRQTAANKMAET